MRAEVCAPICTRNDDFCGSKPFVSRGWFANITCCTSSPPPKYESETVWISFARAWDRFAFGDVRRARARRATRRELLVLTSHLEGSLLEEQGAAPDFGAAIREHRELTARRPPRDLPDEPRSGDPDRAAELGARPGWAWLRVMRRYDEYERAVAALGAQPATAARGGDLQPTQ